MDVKDFRLKKKNTPFFNCRSYNNNHLARTIVVFSITCFKDHGYIFSFKIHFIQKGIKPT